MNEKTNKKTIYPKINSIPAVNCSIKEKKRNMDIHRSADNPENFKIQNINIENVKIQPILFKNIKKSKVKNNDKNQIFNKKRDSWQFMKNVFKSVSFIRRPVIFQIKNEVR